MSGIESADQRSRTEQNGTVLERDFERNGTHLRNPATCTFSPDWTIGLERDWKIKQFDTKVVYDGTSIDICACFALTIVSSMIQSLQ